ncbi:MAG: nucleotidyltransferase [Frankiales bacterium]|nr:nucleotidyltransferase [Frankiales bacterium]
MTRLFSDPVEVCRRDDEPVQFRWRGRDYVVRAVLASWTHTGQWWRAPVVASLGSGETSAAHGSLALEDGEQLWWRVEADSGRRAAMSAGAGVYDLCCDVASGAWALRRVLD